MSEELKRIYKYLDGHKMVRTYQENPSEEKINDTNLFLISSKNVQQLPRIEKERLSPEKIQNRGCLPPYIHIPKIMHTEEHGDLEFRIDKERGNIRILRPNLGVIDDIPEKYIRKQILSSDTPERRR